MLNKRFLNDLSIKIRDLASNSPAGDLERNFNALLQGAFTKLALVSREEFDVQADLMRVTRDKLHNLEIRLAELEEVLQKSNKSGQK